MNRSNKKLVPAGEPHERRHPLAGGGVKITTSVPLRFKKRGIRKVLVAPEGVGSPVSWCTAPGGRHTRDRRREGIIRSAVSHVQRLALLAPDIAEAAVAGRLPPTVSLESLLWATLPLDWGEQREMVAGRLVSVG